MALQAAGGVSRGPQGEDKPGLVELAEMLLVAAVVVQGLALGLWLGGAPASVLALCGLDSGSTLFVRWAGALHAALALAYAVDFLRLRRIALLLATKGATALLLSLVWMAEGLPSLVLLLLAVDASVVIAGALLQAPAERSRRARTRLHLVVHAPVAARAAGGG